MNTLLTKLCLFVFSFIFSLNGTAQNNLPPIYEISTNPIHADTVPGTYWLMLEDKNGKWTINDISQTNFINKFHKHNEPPDNNEALVNTYWFHYRLENNMTSDARIALRSMSEIDDFYLSSSNNKWTHYTTGFLNNWKKKDGLKWSNCIPLVLKPREEISVFQRVHNRKQGLPDNFSIVFLNTEQEIQRNYINNVDSAISIFSVYQLQEAFLIGLLLISMFFNLFFFSVVKEKTYLYFALFALFLSINRLYNILYQYLWFNNPVLHEYIPYLHYAWAFIDIFLVQFVRHFFDTKNNYKKWDTILLSLIIIVILSGVLRFLSEIYLKGSTDIFRVINISISGAKGCALLATLLFYIRARNKIFHFLIIGAFPFLIWDIVGSFVSILDPVLEGTWQIYRPVEVICIMWLVLFFSWTLFLRFNRLRKENAQRALDNERLAKEKERERRQLIEQQKIILEKTVDERTTELKQSLKELKSTQAQLIQQEKMASLGQLTAGIAHEIQNPLNFVNNFSEINTELVDELKNELLSDNKEEALLLADDIKENEQKIIHHGRRADSIVKGMLQHSRASSGKRELTDINALVDECVRLSYHGMRAKDKEFNADIKTELDESIGKINVVPQDISRVLINLLNNAFYAVDEQKRAPTLKGERYEPAVSVCTKKLDGKVEIRVKDNGNGIPQNIVDKIFQPFFTTKPTGQGTGLGLSLSYDIVKTHGGEIKVESKEGEGSEFLILLPTIK